MTVVCEPFGPDYDVSSAALEKFRRAARKGPLSKDERHAYGAAVELAVKSKQRAALMRATPTVPKPRCASGTYHNTGEAIEKAVREQQRAALAAYPGKVRRERSDATWRKMYAEAMIEKHERVAQLAPQRQRKAA